MIATAPSQCGPEVDGLAHDLVRVYFVPRFAGVDLIAEADRPRYLTGIRCDRCGFRPLIDASDPHSIDRLLEVSREP